MSSPISRRHRSAIDRLFVSSLGEAIAIVLAVSFLSLGLRTGTVVALSIPLVLAVTFLLMLVFGIDLQRISLVHSSSRSAFWSTMRSLPSDDGGEDGAGLGPFRAATFAYTSTAFPMLTGTLITAAGFMPVGFSRKSGPANIVLDFSRW